MAEEILGKVEYITTRVDNIQIQINQIIAELEKFETGEDRPIFKPATPEQIAQRRLGAVAETLDSIEVKLDRINEKLAAIKKTKNNRRRK